MQDYHCKICGNLAHNQPLLVREMMFGFREKFEYFRCATCGCLQIAEIPADMSKYYSGDMYYSFQKEKKRKGFGLLIHKLLVRGYFAGFIPQSSRYIRNYQNLLPYLKNSCLKQSSAVLDVGCGIGVLLQEMSVWGFNNLMGIDPFLENDIHYSSGLNILEKDIFNLSGTFDFIMMHHSFEHMDNPLDVLRQCNNLMSPEGRLLIRIPVSDGYPFRKFGANWCAVDAPRHFFLHTTHSIYLLAKDSGFAISEIKHDSHFGFFINYRETYRKNDTYQHKPISNKELKIIKKQADVMNKMLDGGTACFILKKQ